ncbi:MAG: hypothetical protein N3A59_02845 [Thermodesulfovibrionales bacterium]|nr:hypothetical protein [Thermodesulfovibrionales bacterium]
MPLYDFKCGKCGENFSLVMSVKEKESAQIKCPKCNSEEIKQLYLSYYTKTSRKS